MGIIYWLSLEAFSLRVKDLEISDDEAAEMWARMIDPDCEEGEEDRERLWGKNLELYGEYVDKAIKSTREQNK